jgi:hypothetical protein
MIMKHLESQKSTQKNRKEENLPRPKPFRGRVARWYVFKPKYPNWGKFVRALE